MLYTNSREKEEVLRPGPLIKRVPCTLHLTLPLRFSVAKAGVLAGGSKYLLAFPYLCGSCIRASCQELA